MRVAMAGVSLDLAFGSVVVGSSVSIGARASPSRPIPSSRPCAEGSTPTDRASASARGNTSRENLVEYKEIRHLQWQVNIKE